MYAIQVCRLKYEKYGKTKRNHTGVQRVRVPPFLQNTKTHKTKKHMKSKKKTNDQMFKSLFKELEGSIYSALLRERIVVIMDMTMNDIKDHPEAWDKAFIHSSMYEQLNDVVQKHLGFKND
jgi:hypothetical protein